MEPFKRPMRYPDFLDGRQKVMIRPSYTNREPQEAQYEYNEEKYEEKMHWLSIYRRRYKKPLYEGPFEFDISEFREHYTTFEEAKKILDYRMRVYIHDPGNGVNLHSALYFRYLSRLHLLYAGDEPERISLAELLMRSSMEIVRTLNGSENPNYAILMDELSEIVYKRGECELAALLHQRSEEIFRYAVKR